MLSRHLAASNPHLVDSSEDFNARNEAFWFRGGIGPDKSMIKKREGRKDFEEREFRDKVKKEHSDFPHTSCIVHAGCNGENLAS